MPQVKRKKDFTSGPLFIPIFAFVVPIILTGMLQMIYNMADNIVVGRFSGNDLALGAVGSTTSLSNLIVNLLMGVAGGAGVVIAQSYGAKDNEKLSRAIHTSTFFSLIGGIAFCILGLAIAKPALILMETKEEFFQYALTYMIIICLGIPATAVYNFGAAALRSTGDSKTPLFILSCTGILNVLLNLFFVIVCKLSVEGVALATIIAQYISAVTVVTILFKRKNEPYALSMRKMKIHGDILKQILRLGLPAGLQGIMFSISNIILTSGLNQLPKEVISGKTIAINVESLVHTSMNSYLHAAMTFTGQNYGAKKPDRIKRSIIYTLIQVFIIGFVGGQIVNFFGEQLASLYISPADPNKAAVLESALELMNFMLAVYFLCGIMDTISGAMRGLGYSMIPMIVSIGAICILRMIWVFVFFPMERFHNLIGIYTIYPISWSIGIIAMAIPLFFIYKKLKKKMNGEDATENLEESEANA